MANALPSIAIHTGTSGERFNARSRPVTTALKSFTVLFLCRSISTPHSKKIQDAIQVKISTNAFVPKLYTPNTLAGSNAMITSSIRDDVVFRSLTCGDAEILNVVSSMSPPPTSSYLPEYSFWFRLLSVSNVSWQDIHKNNSHTHNIPCHHALRMHLYCHVLHILQDLTE